MPSHYSYFLIAQAAVVEYQADGRCVRRAFLRGQDRVREREGSP